MSLTTVWVTLALSTVVSAGVTDVAKSPGDHVTLNCVCTDRTIQKVYWYRICESGYEYISLYNAADHHVVSKSTLLKDRLEARKSANTYILTVKNLKEEDSGWYSCFGVSTKQSDFDSFRLQVREVVPTPPQPPKTTTKKGKKWKPACCTSYRPPEGCGKWILWPLSGCLIALAVVLAAVLYYFSRLPKKCRHFEKKNQLR
ncbi:uncharacterized protein cd8b [Sardina pilchardus]|uniref:uncharacterized protein cd8b n=1 Tax=Sardina pilchardus TaxID=27697 RepID=UPI002E114C5E